MSKWFNQKGQVGFVFVIFIVVLVSIFSFKKFTTTSTAECNTDPENKIVTLKIDNQTSSYKQVRKGVLIQSTTSNQIARNGYPEIPILESKEHSIKNGIQNLDGIKYLIYSPDKYTEFDIYRNGQITNDYGISGFNIGKREGYDVAFAVYLDSSEQPLVFDSVNQKLEPGKFWKVDIYQNVNNNVLIPSEIFSCGGSQDPNISKQAFFYPSQSPSLNKDQLQLEYLKFKVGGYGWVGHCKPAIYLYPEKEMEVNVRVNTKGYLTYTDPAYPQGGWSILAAPDGGLFTTNHQPLTHNYLYYESKIPDQLIDQPKNGYVVEYAKIVNLYKYLLPKLGLNSEQTKDFIDYWSRALPFANYYYVGVLSQENIDEFEPLEITPKPDYLNRVRVYFKALNEKPAEGLFVPEFPTNLSPPTSSSHLGVVEWGGMVKLDPAHPFTCSQ